MELSFDKIRVIRNKRNEEHESKDYLADLFNLASLCRTIGRLGWGERKRKRAGHNGNGKERRFLFPSSPARFPFFHYRDTQREPLRWKESYYAFHLGPSSSIFVLEFSYHPHESAQVLVYPSTATLKTSHPCFLFYSLFCLAWLRMLCYYPRSFKHTTRAQQFKSFLHAHYWPVCRRSPSPQEK